MDNRVALEVHGLDKHVSEDLELGKGLAMTDSEVAKLSEIIKQKPLSLPIFFLPYLTFYDNPKTSWD